MCSDTNSVKAGSPRGRQHALLILLQCDTELPRDETLGHRTTMHRVRERDQVTAVGGETHSRGIITPMASPQLRKVH